MIIRRAVALVETHIRASSPPFDGPSSSCALETLKVQRCRFTDVGVLSPGTDKSISCRSLRNVILKAAPCLFFHSIPGRRAMAVSLARTPIVSRLLNPASDSPPSGSHLSGFSGRFPCFFGSNVLGGDDSHPGRVSRQAPSVSGNEPSASGQCGIVCMAHPRRQQMVAQQIKRELSEMMLYDKVLREAVVPEAALGADMYLSSVATVSEVELSGDLQVAKVYVSVYGDERGQTIAMEGLKSREGYVRAGLGKRMRLRVTPVVRFIKDESFERGSKVLSILTKLRDERGRKERGEVVFPSSGSMDDKGVVREEEDEVSDGVEKVKERKRRVGQQPSVLENKGVQFVWGKEADENENFFDDEEDEKEYGDDETIIFVK